MRTTSSRPILVRAGLSNDQLQALNEDLKPKGVRVVETVFDALCITGSPRRNSAVNAIFMAPPPLGLSEGEVIQAFRRTDPEIRLILLLPVDEPQRAGSAMTTGFNDAFTLPASTSRVLKAIDPTYTEPDTATETETESTSQHSVEGQPADLPSMREAKATARRSIVEIVLEEACSRIEAEANNISSETTSLFEESIPEGDFGDIQLIRCMMEGEEINQIAIEIIRNKSGIESVRHLVEEDASEGPDLGAGGTCLPIGRPEESLGYLTANTADNGALNSWADWMRYWLILQQRHASLRRQAWTDELTGAGNRRSLYQVLGQVIKRARDERRAVTVMCFDIDNFKTYNDQFGHEAGDEVLRETVQLLRSVIRRGDHVFRVGGDEFVVIFAPDPAGPRSACSSPPESIEQIASRFQHQIGALQLPQIGMDAPGTVSISAGMVTYPWDGQTPGDLLRRADQLALESKRSGKNVISFGPAARERTQDEFTRDQTVDPDA
jgi:diguanylate cyclase (GGDEF)-like protein